MPNSRRVTYTERDVVEFMARGLRTSTSEPNRPLLASYAPRFTRSG
jgi:hypothetical protein